MPTVHERRARRGFALLRIVRARPRLFGSVALAIAVAAVLALLTNWRPAARLLVG